MALARGGREYVAIVRGREFRVRIEPDGEELRVQIDGEEFLLAGDPQGDGESCLLLDGRPQVVNVRSSIADRYRVMLGSGEMNVEIRDPVSDRMRSRGGTAIQESRIEIRSPMHGNIVSVAVRPGDRVEEEESLLVIEAMKMQNAVTSPARATVKEVRVNQGEAVEGESILVVLERDDPPTKESDGRAA